MHEEAVAEAAEKLAVESQAKALLLTKWLFEEAGGAVWLLSCCSAGEQLDMSCTASALLADDRLLRHSEPLRWPCCCDKVSAVTA